MILRLKTLIKCVFINPSPNYCKNAILGCGFLVCVIV